MLLYELRGRRRRKCEPEVAARPAAPLAPPLPDPLPRPRLGLTGLAVAVSSAARALALAPCAL